MSSDPFYETSRAPSPGLPELVDPLEYPPEEFPEVWWSSPYGTPPNAPLRGGRLPWGHSRARLLPVGPTWTHGKRYVPWGYNSGGQLLPNVGVSPTYRVPAAGWPYRVLSSHGDTLVLVRNVGSGPVSTTIRRNNSAADRGGDWAPPTRPSGDLIVEVQPATEVVLGPFPPEDFCDTMGAVGTHGDWLTIEFSAPGDVRVAAVQIAGPDLPRAVYG